MRQLSSMRQFPRNALWKNDSGVAMRMNEPKSDSHLINLSLVCYRVCTDPLKLQSTKCIFDGTLKSFNIVGCSVLPRARTHVASTDELQLLEGARGRRGCYDRGTTEQRSERQRYFEAVLVTSTIIPGKRIIVQTENNYTV